MISSKKAVIILGLACIVAVAFFRLTRQPDGLPPYEKEAMKEIFPDGESFAPGTAGGVEYYEVSKDGSFLGYCLKVAGTGYGGEMSIMAGVDPDGAIKGMKILEHRETAGIGSRINGILPGERQPRFLKQFIGKDARTVALGRNVDAITGATISCAAVTDAVRKAAGNLPPKTRK